MIFLLQPINLGLGPTPEYTGYTAWWIGCSQIIKIKILMKTAFFCKQKLLI